MCMAYARDLGTPKAGAGNKDLSNSLQQPHCEHQLLCSASCFMYIKSILQSFHLKRLIMWLFHRLSLLDVLRRTCERHEKQESCLTSSEENNAKQLVSTYVVIPRIRIHMLVYCRSPVAP